MKYPTEQIENMLTLEADLEDYFIVEATNLKSGLIHYVDREREKCWISTDERDALTEACIEYLKAKGNPIFNNNIDVNAHIEFLLQKEPSCINP